jgi:tight adherence protein C
VIAALGKVLIGDAKDREEIEASLRAAGYDSPYAPLVFAWARLLLAAGAGLATALVLVLLHRWHGWGPFAAWAAFGGSYVVSKPLVRWNAARRERRVTAELPLFLDMLTMMLESGVSLDQALRMVASEAGAAPMIRAVTTLLAADLQRGMPHEQAYDRWADRLGVQGGRELAALFKRALAHGSGLSAALAAFAREFTERRVSLARESVGKRTTQLTMAMMVFFMPALFIVIAGPAAATLMKTFGGRP